MGGWPISPGPDGALELAGVRTPHIGGIVEFYAREGEQLRIVAELPGYSSHVLGTRNLDMAVAADLDGDGGAELAAHHQRHDGFAQSCKGANV